MRTYVYLERSLYLDHCLPKASDGTGKHTELAACLTSGESGRTKKTDMHRFTKGIAALALVVASALLQAQEVPDSIKRALKKADSAVAAIVAVPDDKHTFENTLGALDDLSTRLDTDTSLFIFMENVSTNADERDQARAADEAVSNWAVALGKREDLYKAIKAYADTKPKLDGEKARLLEFTMRDYRRAGMNLPKDQREKLQANEQEQNKLNIDFEHNIAEDDTHVAYTAAELKGVPKAVLDRQQRSGDLYLLGMDYPTYDGVIQNCPIEETRHKLWVAFRRRAGETNKGVLEKLIKLRWDEATMLGYSNTVDYTLEPRMAKNAKTVADFYTKLRPIVRKKALIDWKEFETAKRQDTHNPKAVFEPWDYGYYKDYLMKKKYAVDREKVREYFPMEAVVSGLFSITQKLYGIEYKDVTADAAKLGLPIWHPDVKLYEVDDVATHEMLGHFYTDLYPRPNKYTHAACWGLQERKVYMDGTLQLPLAAMVCNFTKPTADKPSLVEHDEVETFFHEFGHCLHNMLTKTTLGRFSGTSVALDFVEAPSQMFENWVWNGKVLGTFARHYKTGKPLPDSLLKGMIAARNLGSGIESEGQFYLGLMDQDYHTAPGGKVDTTKVALELYPEVTLYPKGSNAGTMFQSSFGHLTNYESAYYGYMWSLVFASDMFQRFEQLGLLDPKAGAYYRDKILAHGGSVDEMAMLKDYLGREPKLDAFLKHLGLNPEEKK